MESVYEKSCIVSKQTLVNFAAHVNLSNCQYYIYYTDCLIENKMSGTHLSFVQADIPKNDVAGTFRRVTSIGQEKAE